MEPPLKEMFGIDLIIPLLCIVLFGIVLYYRRKGNKIRAINAEMEALNKLVQQQNREYIAAWNEFWNDYLLPARRLVSNSQYRPWEEIQRMDREISDMLAYCDRWARHYEEMCVDNQHQMKVLTLRAKRLGVNV